MPRFILFLLLLFVSAENFANPADSVFYSWVNSGKTVGLEWAVQKGSHDYYFYDEFNDRGRGPSVHTHLVTGDNAMITNAEFTGVDYYKAVVQESYHVANGKAYWKNKFENDSTVFHGEVYADINGPLASYSLIFGMMRAQKTQEINVLPAGKHRYDVVTTANIMDSHGTPMALKLVAFSGSGSAPFYLWFTNGNKFFGLTSDWSSLVLKGYEKWIDTLYGIQKPYEDKFYSSLAIKLTQKQPAGIAIEDATIFDTQTGDTIPGQTVLISDNVIKKVGDYNTVAIPAGYKVIDGRGKFLMPGLWDMHCHFSKDQGPFMLAQGVTNIRDMGNSEELLVLRDEINKDSLLGPNVTYISGLIDKAGKMAAPTGALVNTLDEALKAVQDYKNKGYDQIKIYSSVEPSWVKPMADKAHSLGMRVCGHIPAFMTASQAIDAGYNEVTHINMLFLNFFGDTVDTRNMTRLTLPGRLGYTIDIKGEAAQKFIKQLKDKQIVLDPTMSAFEDIFEDLPGQVARKYAPISYYMPAEVKRQQMNGSYLDADSLISTYKASFDNMEKMLKELYDNGLTILAGTDVGVLPHELEIYSQAGIPNKDVLRMATYWPAKVSGKDNILGSITEGKLANLVLIDGNPLKNMQDIRRVYVTIKESRLYWPKDIYASFGWGYYY